MKVRLSIPYGPHRYGPGKIHVLSKESAYTLTWCGRSVHGKEQKGDISEATCLKCNPNADLSVRGPFGLPGAVAVTACMTQE